MTKGLYTNACMQHTSKSIQTCVLISCADQKGSVKNEPKILSSQKMFIGVSPGLWRRKYDESQVNYDSDL